VGARMNNNKGQISVFLCITFIAVLIVVGVLVDAARIISGQAQVRRAATNSVRSLLADYSSDLKENYGIFAINKESEQDLSANAREYLERNLSIGLNELQNFNIYDFKVEKISITPLFNLTEDQAVKSQILEYMKYRAPNQVVENLWQKISVVREFGEIAGTYNRKINLDKLSGQIGELQQMLKEKISGTIGNGLIQEHFINGYDRDGIRYTAIERYAETIIKQSALHEELSTIFQHIQQIENQANDESNIENNWILKERLNKLQDRAANVKAELETQEDIIHSMERWLKEELTGEFLKVNKDARQIMEHIAELGRRAQVEVQEFEDYLREKHEVDSISYQNIPVCENIMNAFQEDIINLKDIILNGKIAEELLHIICNNILYLETAMERLDKVCQLDWQKIDGDIGKEEIISFLTEGFGSYNNSLEYEYKKVDNPIPGIDPRTGKDKETEKALKDENGDVDIGGEGINISELPSRKKYYSDNSAVFEGELYDLPGEIDLDDNDSMFIHKAFNYIRNMGNLLTSDISSFRDDIYINEYILKVFNNHIEAQEDNTFFKSEVEYILHGDSSERINKIKTKAQILLVRFAMNTLHVYSDSSKRELAKGIAAAAAGWWTAGAGIPIISNLILCGWGMGEAIIDLEDLMDGKPVPFYKLKEDWKLDVGIFSNQNPINDGVSSKSDLKSDSRIMFDYKDYLRIFLIFVNADKKIGRIEDLIELNGRKTNSEFKVANYSTYLKIEAEVSLNYIFLTKAFIPKSKKTIDGRHCFKVVLYEGY
jgi:uncharacterized protein (DUF2164 family)